MGFFWWLGKGDETHLTSLGRITVSFIIIVGAFVGASWGWAIDVTRRSEMGSEKPKRDAPQEHLWDRELDG